MRLLDRLVKTFRRPARETAAERAEWIENAVRGVAARAQQEQVARLRHAARSFEGAETPPWVASWATTAAGINEDLQHQLPILRARSRQLARNNEWARRYRLQLVDNVLGVAGIRLQMRVRQPANPRQPSDGTLPLDTETNALIEKGWERWGRRGSCDVSGKLSWKEIEKLMLWTLATDGEILYRFRIVQSPFRIQLQILDPTLLDVTLRREYQGRRVRLGVEIDDDGRPVAYWLRAAKAGDLANDLSAIGAHVRLPADQVRHRFVVEEVDQLRGVPPLAIGARRLHMLHDFEEAAAVACSNSAKRLGFFVSPTGEAPETIADQMVSSVLEAAKAAGKVLTPEEVRQLNAAAEKYTTTVPGTFDTIPTGYDFRQYDSPWPNVDSTQYVKGQVRGWSAAQGVSYVSIGNDLSDVNYSSARVGILDEREHHKEWQATLISFLHQEVFEEILPYIVAATPGLEMSRLADYLAAATWQARRWQGIDPVKEASADEKNLQNSLTSRSRIIMSRGEDPEEVAAEIAADEALFGPLPRPSALTLAASDTSADPDAAGDAAPARRNFLPRFTLRPVRQSAHDDRR